MISTNNMVLIFANFTYLSYRCGRPWTTVRYDLLGRRSLILWIWVLGEVIDFVDDVEKGLGAGFLVANC